MSEKDAAAFRTISEVAEDLDLPQHVLRFWETKFSQIRPMKSSGGRRFYRPDDIVLLRAIREMLYGQGYTIRGVQRLLKERGARSLSAQNFADGSGAHAAATASADASARTSEVAPPASVAVAHAVSDVPALPMKAPSVDMRAVREELQACIRILREARAGRLRDLKATL